MSGYFVEEMRCAALCMRSDNAKEVDDGAAQRVGSRKRSAYKTTNTVAMATQCVLVNHHHRMPLLYFALASSSSKPGD